jgi:hypothetical protein
LLNISFTDGISQISSKIIDRDGLATSEAERVFFNDRLLEGGAPGANQNAVFDSFVNGGIRLTWSEGSLERYFGILHIKAPNAKVFTNTFPTATGTKDITGFGFDPNTVLATSGIITMPELLEMKCPARHRLCRSGWCGKNKRFLFKGGVATTVTRRFNYDALLANATENGLFNRIDFDQYIADWLPY